MHCPGVFIASILALGALGCSSAPLSPPANEDPIPEALKCPHPLVDQCRPRHRSYPGLLSGLSQPQGTIRKEPESEKPEVTEPKAERPELNGVIAADIDLDEAEEEAPREGPAVAGQMTERAADAKRLFDKERWNDAVVQLEATARGRFHDDQGNRELAEYYLAIALYRIQDYTAATDLFVAIVERKQHLKAKEGLLWLMKLATLCPDRRVIRALGEYPFDFHMGFRSPQQKDLWISTRFAHARGLADLGRIDEAIREFIYVREEPLAREAATTCLEGLDPDWKNHFKRKRAGAAPED